MNRSIIHGVLDILVSISLPVIGLALCMMGVAYGIELMREDRAAMLATMHDQGCVQGEQP